MYMSDVKDILDEILNGAYDPESLNPKQKKTAPANTRIIRIVDRGGKAFEFTGNWEIDRQGEVLVCKARPKTRKPKQ
jgi:uncharacterized Ntn-hydrolase superfamily protein